MNVVRPSRMKPTAVGLMGANFIRTDRVGSYLTEHFMGRLASTCLLCCCSSLGEDLAHVRQGANRSYVCGENRN